MVAEPLDQGIAEDIERGTVSIKSPNRVIGKFFEENYGWDLLASRSIWAFGLTILVPIFYRMTPAIGSELEFSLVLAVADASRSPSARIIRSIGPFIP